MGARMEAPPTAKPPRKRATRNIVKFGASPVPSEVRAKSVATQSSGSRRPNRSARNPMTREPSAQPKSRELKATPKLKSARSNCVFRNGPAPVMMATSKPNMSPPSAPVMPRKKTYLILMFFCIRNFPSLQRRMKSAK